MKFIKFEIESINAADSTSSFFFFKSHGEFLSKVECKFKRKNNFSIAAALSTIVKNVCIFCNSNTHTWLECKILTNEQKIYINWNCFRCFFEHLQSVFKVKIRPVKHVTILNIITYFAIKQNVKYSSKSRFRIKRRHSNNRKWDHYVIGP